MSSPRKNLIDGVGHFFCESLSTPFLSEADLHHLINVLRFGPRDFVTISDDRSQWGCFEVASFPLDLKTAIERQKTGQLWVAKGPSYEIPEIPSPILAVAFVVNSTGQARDVVHGLVEVGVDTIIPVVSDFSGLSRGKLESSGLSNKLRRAAMASACQAKRLRIPQIESVLSVDEVIGRYRGRCLMADFDLTGQVEHGPSHLLISEQKAQPRDDERALAGEIQERSGDIRVLLVGPAGGWSERERALGVDTIDLGPGVLRSETAAVVGGFYLINLCRFEGK